MVEEGNQGVGMKDISCKKREKIVPRFWHQKQTNEVKIG